MGKWILHLFLGKPTAAGRLASDTNSITAGRAKFQEIWFLIRNNDQALILSTLPVIPSMILLSSR